MIPGKYNMVCPQGSTFNKVLIYSVDNAPVQLDGYLARMQIREKYNSANAQISLNTENGGISIDGELGEITINIDADVTESISAKEYVYDLELISSGNIVTRIIEGKFIVTPEVTR